MSTEGFPVSASHDEFNAQILEALEADESVSQRSLAKTLGIALGLTNLLLKRLVVRGLICLSRVQPHRVKYLLTPAGMAEKTRMSQLALQQAVTRYRVARGRLEVTLAEVAAAFPASVQQHGKPVMFLGTGELAEIGFICLQGFDLRLVGAFDDSGRARFFGVPVFSVERLSTGTLDQYGQARLIVVSLWDRARARQTIAAGDIPADRVYWV